MALFDATEWIVLDLECTCDNKSFPKEDMEIIEIGAVKLHPISWDPISEFETMVRPSMNPRLTEFCKELTGISQNEVDSAPMFPEALKALCEWVGPSSKMCSWGDFDRIQLQRDCKRHRLEVPAWTYENHVNAREEFARWTSIGKSTIPEACGLMGLRFEGDLHRALDDARNVAAILREYSRPDS